MIWTWRSVAGWVFASAAAALAATVVSLAVMTDTHGRWLGAAALAGAAAAYQAYRYLSGAARRGAIGDPLVGTIEALARAIEARDKTAPEHVRRVQQYATALAKEIGLPDAEIQSVRIAALVHDIGMLAVPEHILSKPDPLTPEEYQKIRRHPMIGADLLESVPFARDVGALIRGHHERWDGLGYPDGLKGDAIPVGARIVALAEHFDALTSDRPYHKAMPMETAIRLLHQEAGGAFDPSFVEHFVAILPALVATEPGRGSEEGGQTSDQNAPGDLATAYQEIARAHHEIYLLWDIAQSLGASIGVSDTMRLIAAKLSQIVPYDCCALFLPDPEGETLRCRFAWGRDQDIIERVTVKIGKGLAGWVARARRPLVNGSPRMDTAEATTLQSALVYPLIFHDRFVGALALYNTDPDCYSEEHSRLLSRVAYQIAAAIANSQIFDQAQEDSLTDPLTGLPNTRSLFMHMTRELARARRLQSTLALLVIDLDDFKRINDRFGHHVGDRALCEAARVLRTAIRPYDICVRYAGDEFILVLSGCSSEEAARKHGDLQKTIGGTFFESRPGVHLPLSVSVGVAMYPDDGDTYEKLLATADRRMYTDKTRQKRRAVSGAADPNYSEGELESSATGVL